MASRTIKCYGKVWGDPENPATLTVTWAGTQVFQGPVTTVTGTADTSVTWEDMIELCTWEIDSSFAGSEKFTFSITNGDAVWHTLHGNLPDGSYTDLSGSSTIESDGHNNVTINEIAQVRIANESELGKWNWLVPDGATLQCDVVVIAVDNTPAN